MTASTMRHDGMSTARWKAVAVMVLMLASTTLAHIWKPDIHMADERPKIELATVFPERIGDWVADKNVPIQIISPDQQALLNKIYNQTLTRVYVNPQRERIMLSVAYGGDQSEGTRAHRPEVCYPNQGFEMLSNHVGTIALPNNELRVRRLVARQDTRVEPITYWIVVGDHVALSSTEQKLEQMRYSLTRMLPDGMLVRVSTIQNDTEQGFAVQQRFIAQLDAAVAPGFRTRVFGGGG